MQASAAKRRAVNLSIDAAALREAKLLDINTSRAAEAGLIAAIKKEKERRWLNENQRAIAAQNAWIEKHGVPLTPLWMRDDGAL